MTIDTGPRADEVTQQQDAVTPPDRGVPPTAQRALRGYGPLLAFGLVFALMAAFMPSVVRDTSGVAEDGLEGEAGESVYGPSTGGTEGEAGESTDGGGGGGTQGTAGTAGKPGSLGATEEQIKQRRAAAKGSCPDRREQVPGDPYSPPCVAFSGSNGGATSRGVTDKEIIVSARILDEKGFQQTLAALAGAEITDGPADIKRTISAYAEYFNKRFQFYGRKITIKFYNGKGSSTDELLGGGQDGAAADAIHVAQNEKAFVELNGATAPFCDALAKQKVICMGTPYLSRKWHQEHRPYNWSIATDCSVVAETAGEMYVKQLGGKNADFAGPGLKGKKRVLAGLSPENPWYAECHNAFDRVIQKGLGKKPDDHRNYRLDINSMSNQAANVISALKDRGVTTVFCGCDPIFPVFLTTKGAEQGFNPEWIVVGVALTDHDLVGQLYDQEQWARAYGVSFSGSIVPQRAGLGYAAYKTVRNDEPAFAAELIYALMYVMVLGFQGAGPTLNPATFEKGLFTYPGGTGMYGTWGFGPGIYTPQRDTRLIWWNPSATSAFNSKKGAYIESYGGRRFPIGKLPSGAPDAFR